MSLSPPLPPLPSPLPSPPPPPHAAARSPWISAPPAPPAPPRGPSFVSGVPTLLATLGALIAVALVGLLAVPKLLQRHGEGDDRESVRGERARGRDAAPTKAPPKDVKTPRVLPILASDPVLGDARARVTIVEFTDFQCPYCGRAQATLAALRKEYGAKLRIVWKDEPLSFHTQARPAARVARIALLVGGPPAFWTLKDLIYGDQGSIATKLAGWGTSVGVDASAVARFGAQADGLIDDAEALAKTLGATGTPMFFIDGERLSGAQPIKNFEAMINAHLAEADALLKDGVAEEDLYATLTDQHYRESPPPATTPPTPPPPTHAVVAVPPGAPSRGLATAAVTIQVFGDFQCLYTRKAMTTDFLAAVAAHPLDVRVVWRNNALSFHPLAEPAAEVAMEALAEKGNASFWRVEEAIFKLPTLTAPGLDAVATAEGLDLTKVHAAMTGHTHKKSIDDDAAAASRAAITGTPSFVVGDEIVVGAQPASAFEEAIARQLAKKALKPPP